MDRTGYQDSVKLLGECDQGLEESTVYDLHQVTSRAHARPLEVRVQVDSQALTMELDMGAAVSVVSDTLYRHLWLDLPLQESSAKLCTYSGEALEVLGELMVNEREAGCTTTADSAEW